VSRTRGRDDSSGGGAVKPRNAAASRRKPMMQNDLQPGSAGTNGERPRRSRRRGRHPRRRGACPSPRKGRPLDDLEGIPVREEGTASARNGREDARSRSRAGRRLPVRTPERKEP